MSAIKLSTPSSGSISLSPADTASNLTITVPAVTGTMLTTASTGTVLQTVSVTKSDIFTTTSQSFVDVTGLTVSITPTSSTSKILVFMTVTNAASVVNVVSQFTQLVRNSTALATFRVGAPAADQAGSLNFNYLDSPATASATTYKVQIRGDGATVGVNTLQNNNSVNAGSSTITVMEIAA
jgi:hypothetical protein